jgi:hypothetical protein
METWFSSSVFSPLQQQQTKHHDHLYNLDVADTIVVRWCEICGMAWKLERYGTTKFGDQWVVIQEASSR